jgi:LPS sulfotransferase NodH
MPDSYIICGTPRTGSTLLCELMAATKVAGTPDSFFMREVDPIWIEEWGLPARGILSDRDYSAAYLKAAIKSGRGRTTIFGLRLMRANLEELSSLIDKVFSGLPSDKARLEAAFGDILYIHLTRQDTLAQAVSMVKAEQTGLWHIAPDGSEIERLAPPREPEYDFDRITAKVAELARYDAGWVTWFRSQKIEPLRIDYERLAANPAAVVTRICDALGVPAPAHRSLRPGVAKLADAVSADWMRRYRRDLEAAASR